MKKQVIEARTAVITSAAAGADILSLHGENRFSFRLRRRWYD